jgi:hypothetical protein
MPRRPREDDAVPLKEFMLAKFADQERAVASALAAVEKATATLATATEKRLENLNEFRGMLSDQAALGMPRAEYEAMHRALIAKVEDLDRRREEEIARLLGLHTALELRVSGRLDTTSGEGKGAEAERAALQAAASARSRTLGLVIAAVGVLLTGMTIAVTVLIAAIHGGG